VISISILVISSTTAWIRVCCFSVLCISLIGCTKSFNYYHNNAEETRYCDPAFGQADLAEESLAIGGVVLSWGCRLDDQSGIDIEPEDLNLMVQSELWTPVLEKIVRSKVPYSGVFGWPAVVEGASLDLRLETYDIVAHRGRLKPGQIAEWATSLPHPRYLALARVERTWHDNQGTDNWMAASGIGRVVTLTLEIYDLKRGVSVWSHWTQRHVFPGADANELDRSGNYQVRSFVDFDTGLEDALRHAVDALPYVESLRTRREAPSLDEKDF